MRQADPATPETASAEARSVFGLERLAEVPRQWIQSLFIGWLFSVIACRANHLLLPYFSGHRRRMSASVAPRLRSDVRRNRQ